MHNFMPVASYLVPTPQNKNGQGGGAHIAFSIPEIPIGHCVPK